MTESGELNDRACKVTAEAALGERVKRELAGVELESWLPRSIDFAEAMLVMHSRAQCGAEGAFPHHYEQSAEAMEAVGPLEKITHHEHGSLKAPAGGGRLGECGRAVLVVPMRRLCQTCSRGRVAGTPSRYCSCV
jgi:hypothetical protein